MLPYMAQTVSLLRAPARRQEYLAVGIGWPQNAVSALPPEYAGNEFSEWPRLLPVT